MLVLLAPPRLIATRRRQRREIEEDFDDSDDSDDDDDPELGFTESIYYMAAITLFISILSDVIVDTIEERRSIVELSVAFISVVMLHCGNAAEHASAVMFALRNKMDISIGVAIGSSTQIAMFVFPFCVCVAWSMNKPLDLNMKVFEKPCRWSCAW